MSRTFVVSTGVADVRRQPDPAAELVTQALMNRAVEIAESSGEWTHVTLSDYTGWLQTSALEEPITVGFCKVGETCATPLGLRAVINTPRTLLYSAASGAAETQGYVYLSSPLPVLDATHERRVQVALPGEREAWLEREAITLQTADELYPRGSAHAVTRYARQYLDVPYLWGGTSYEGIDCSGFVQLCYRMGGYTIPRDADQQHDALVQSVIRTEMREGDLLFFGSEAITHVGMALNEHEYIHAEGQNYNRVVINSLRAADSHYYPRLDQIVWAIKRVIEDASADAEGVH